MRADDDPTFTDEEIAKLPKWARNRIEIMVMRLREARESQQQAIEAAGFREEDYGHYGPIKPYDSILFGGGGLDAPDRHRGIEVRLSMFRPDTITVRSKGGTPLAVGPSSSNSIRVQVQDHGWPL